MDTKKELKNLLWIVVIFTAVFFLPLESERFMTAIDATLDLAKWYAREHVVLCLLPAFFIAGVIAVFIRQGSVLKYFGAEGKKMAFLYGSRHIGRHSCCLLVYYSAPVYKYL